MSKLALKGHHTYGQVSSILIIAGDLSIYHPLFSRSVKVSLLSGPFHSRHPPALTEKITSGVKSSNVLNPRQCLPRRSTYVQHAHTPLEEVGDVEPRLVVHVQRVIEIVRD